MNVTKIELDREGKPARVYHERRGSGRMPKVSAVWTHAADEATRTECAVCQEARR